MFAGTAQSVEKFIFDVDARTISLEMKNIVAITSFMVELKLVEAWLADKAAEALRCQKLLLEEEEAALKRQAEASERKRLKKLRQKLERPKGLVKADATAGKELFLTHQLASVLVKDTHEATTANSSILSKNDNYKDLEPVASNNGNEICPEKIKPGDQNLSANVSQKVHIDDHRDQEHKAQPCSCRENVVMIGSLILPLGNGNDQCSEEKCNHNWFYLAEDFLAQRWKGAMEAQHVKLVLSPEAENLPKDD
ncbi:uncharacterized protein M6B38_167125 [Iris pallida]|uniref:Uncharacterized protein n=1 Tax=Iris pallida TaxID=29817 RepID=A0AAX6EXB5_IRIPA|nr:uncharacterized protein M6B38_167125 [Iris pallida]